MIWQPGTYVRGEKSSIKSEDGSAPGKRNQIELFLIAFLFSIRIAKATAAYRPPHLRQTTRQVPKLHEDVPVKPVSQQAPRVPKPGGVEELFTGDLEKDKKIKQIHKVCIFFFFLIKRK